MSRHKLFFFINFLFVLSLVLFGCRKAETHAVGEEMPTLKAVRLGGGKLKVVATTTLVGDVARQVGGEQIELSVLIPAGSDPHAFVPTPQDVARVAEAHVLLVNGLGLEEFLPNLIKGIGKEVPVVPVSYGIEPIAGGHEHEHEHAEEHEHEHEHGGRDPHVWFDPNLVMVWADNIAGALSALDPAHAEAFKANAEAYKGELQALDAWIREQVAAIPKANRKLVTDHTAFGYFAARYGFEQVGAVFPGYSSLAAPSAKDLAELEEAIRRLEVKAVFVGQTVNPDLAAQVARDTGTRLVFVYTGSLSGADGPAVDYISYMRYNVRTIVEGLK